MIEKPLEEMAAFFDRRHNVHDEVHTANIDGGAESKRIPAAFLPPDMEALLDLGIGTGLELESVFSRFPHAQVTGLLSEQEYHDAQSRQDKLFSDYEKLRQEQELSMEREYHFDTPCTVKSQISML